jgi:hypothetical protein
MNVREVLGPYPLLQQSLNLNVVVNNGATPPATPGWRPVPVVRRVQQQKLPVKYGLWVELYCTVELGTGKRREGVVFSCKLSWG